MLKFRKRWIFEHNVAPNYFIVKTFHITKDLNAKKTIFGDFRFFDFKGNKGENR